MKETFEELEKWADDVAKDFVKETLTPEQYAELQELEAKK